jgi:hypothetical protein
MLVLSYVTVIYINTLLCTVLGAMHETALFYRTFCFEGYQTGIIIPFSCICYLIESLLCYLYCISFD